MKMIHTLRRLLAAILVLLPGLLTAQHDLTLYNTPSVPQRIFLNPAFIPAQRFYIGIPALSGFQSYTANPFAYNDVIERGSDDSLTFKVDNFVSKLSKNDRFRLGSNVEILSLGTQLAGGKFFLGLSIRERMTGQSQLPVNLANLVWYGNASEPVFGKEINIAPSVDLTAFDEWGASFAGYALKNRLTWGVRLKYLSGRFNVTTTSNEFTVLTDTGSYRMTMRSDLEFRTSGVDDIDTYFDQRISKLVFPPNYGAGLDIGATYQVNDRIAVNASVLDIGFINWNYKTLDLVSHNPGETFVFQGVSLNGFIEMLDSLDNFGVKLKDSILDLVEIDSVYGQRYTSWLPTRYNAGGSYILNEHHRFNLLLNATAWRKQFNPALSVSYCFSVPRLLDLVVSYNLFNRQYTNIGAGLCLNAGPVQLYAVSDNIPGLIWYKGSNNYSFQFGINIALNRKTAVAEAPQSEPPPGP